jgi:hypothetical protein
MRQKCLWNFARNSPVAKTVFSDGLGQIDGIAKLKFMTCVTPLTTSGERKTITVICDDLHDGAEIKLPREEQKQ